MVGPSIYSGTYYNPSTKQPNQQLSTAMLASMNRPPSIPPHPGAPFSYSSYSSHHASQSRPEIVAPSQQISPRDPSGSQNHAQQLPSLRTLLEPEFLEKKSSDAPQRPNGPQSSQSGRARYDSSSPTLKRRHDYEAHPQGYSEHNATTSQTSSYLHRPTASFTHADARSATSPTLGSATHLPHQGFQRRESVNHYPSHYDHPSKLFRPTSRMSDTGPSTGQLDQDEGADIGRPVRRRLDGTSRAPIRSSRCIGQRDMPGEGLCYIYEDGTYCRAIIDGEPVNPSWGITKAGKPRKRLAQACLTCREKKIKCEPGFPKCHQCAKSQRVCRGGVNQAGMNNAPGETSPSVSTPMSKNPSVEVQSPRLRTDRNGLPGDLRETSKRADLYNTGTLFKYRNFLSTSGATSQDMSTQSVGSDWSGSAHEQSFEDPGRGSYHDQRALLWEQDPFETDPRMTMHLLDLYFLNAGQATYALFPRRPFLGWVESDRAKHQDQLMLLYSVLAIGSLFSAELDRYTLGNCFAAVASYAAEKRFGSFSLQLCQSRLMLALYHFALGNSQEAWDFCGAGLRAISALKLNTEEGVKELTESASTLKYGFDRLTYEECCRRTFWSGLLMDRYNGLYGATTFGFSVEDAHVGLPCPDSMYATSTPCDAPYLDDELLSRRPSHIQLMGDMAHLCVISALWGDVLTFTGRATHRPDNSFERQYEEFYTKTYEKLEAWHGLLPANLRYSPLNLESSITEGRAGTFLSIHALYHATIIRLNRHVRIRTLSAEKLRRNIEQCFRHASDFLSIMHSLATIKRQQRLASHVAPESLLSTPFPSYALMLSIDVLTSAGTFSSLPSLIETVNISVSCIDELAVIWSSARAQQTAISSRVKQVSDITAQESQLASNGVHEKFWKTGSSLDTALGDNDALYKVEDQLLFDIVGQLTSH